LPVYLMVCLNTWRNLLGWVLNSIFFGLGDSGFE